MRKLVFAFMVGFLLPLYLIAQNTKGAVNTKAKTSTSAAPVGHAIEIVLKPYQNTKIYMLLLQASGQMGSKKRK